MVNITKELLKKHDHVFDKMVSMVVDLQEIDEMLYSMNLLLIERVHYKDIIDNSYQYVCRTFMFLFDKNMLDFPYTFGDRIFTL